MSVLQFIASLVRALVWPVAIAVSLWWFRAPLTRLIDGAKRLGVGFRDTRIWVDIEASAARAESDARDGEPPRIVYGSGSMDVGADLAATGGTYIAPSSEPQLDPLTMMASTFEQLVNTVRGTLEQHGVNIARTEDWVRLPLIAHERSLITTDTAVALQGLEVLHDLAMTRPEGVTRKDADDYLQMANATLFALYQNLGRPRPQPLDP